MKLTNKEQMNAIDQEAIAEYGIPGVLLMEHAAHSVFQYVKGHYKEDNSVTILCGPGNNGGDGLALARQLSIWSKHKVEVILITDPKMLSGDGLTYYKICQKMGLRMRIGCSLVDIQETLEKTDIIIDALFGTGLMRPIEGDYYKVIEIINKAHREVISIDMPSGISADTGKVLGIAVKANTTVTFALPKVGLYVYPGIEYVGKVVITDIGIPQPILEKCPSPLFMMDREAAKACLPKRYTRSNKGTYGKALIIGGKKGMSGAVTLAVQSCMCSGAGTVTAAVPQNIHDILETKLTESMTIALPDYEGHIGYEAVAIVRGLIAKYDVIAIGPGIGRSEEIKELIKVVVESDKPCVIDADGLYALKDQLDLLKTRKTPIVITPHPGEMAYLIDQSIEKILEDPLTVTKEFVEEYPVVLVLKLERTIIAGSKQTFINTTGNDGLSKGGSGDVLTGIITALIGQKVPLHEAARLGVYIHGKVADKMIEEKSRYSLLPCDISRGIGKIFRELED